MSKNIFTSTSIFLTMGDNLLKNLENFSHNALVYFTSVRSPATSFNTYNLGINWFPQRY
ncbi:hypothetical protein [Iningainema tapete]|uniref:Uncharacterized protein n=1 Tax=Iningainema tapete BLCC-T55 TaxID=2748662 RepID=A0A8J6XQ79_9CYAN|nr:hypothetical protein [Iningainema tapete]MBD2776215.1 hypothetical protein [Iningainema tapete BLCC-T55]